jgi:hypothetical protein
VVKLAYLIYVTWFEPHDPRWREMCRRDEYRRKAKY